jgi:hypothetical protein
MKGVFTMIRNTLRTESPADTESADGEPDLREPSPRDENTTSATLYECPSCGAVLIEPPSDECSQCPSETLVEV